MLVERETGDNVITIDSVGGTNKNISFCPSDKMLPLITSKRVQQLPILCS